MKLNTYEQYFLTHDSSRGRLQISRWLQGLSWCSSSGYTADWRRRRMGTDEVNSCFSVELRRGIQDQRCYALCCTGVPHTEPFVWKWLFTCVNGTTTFTLSLISNCIVSYRNVIKFCLVYHKCDLKPDWNPPCHWLKKKVFVTQSKWSVPISSYSSFPLWHVVKLNSVVLVMVLWWKLQ